MAEKKKRARIPESVIEAIHGLILGGARQLDVEDAENAGYDTWDVVAKVEAAVRREAKQYDKIVFRDWVARLVPNVLGKVPKKKPVFWQPLLPGMVLPAYFSIPTERDEKNRALGQPRWKRDRKATPDELKRVIDHERKDIAGRQGEVAKMVVVRETALRRGCEVNEAIGPYMEPDGPSPRPAGERPRPHA